MQTHAVDAWYADNARWLRAHEGRIVDAPNAPPRRPLPVDVHHLYYLLLRCEALGLPVGPLDEQMQAQPTRVSTFIPTETSVQRDETRSVLSFAPTLASAMSSLWGSSSAPPDPDAPFRYIYGVLTRAVALQLRPPPANRLAGFEDVPGNNAVPLHSFRSMRHLKLHGVDPRMLIGWDRACVQLQSLECRYAPIADVTEIFAGLVQRDAGGVQAAASDEAGSAGASSSAAGERGAPPAPLPAAAWHALRYVNLAENQLTFVPASALHLLPSLTHLDLSSNLLNSVPPALAELPNLVALNLAHNLIDSVLLIYEALPAVRQLNLSHNRLESLCGLERVSSLREVDLRHNAVADAGEVGRLAPLPRLTTVWVAGNPLTEYVPDYRVACYAAFAAEGHDHVCLDDQPPGFFERRRIAALLPYQRATDVPAEPAAQPAPSDTPAPAPRARIVKSRRKSRRTVPLAEPQPPSEAEQIKAAAQAGTAVLSTPEKDEGRAPRPSETPAALRERIERLRGDAGDDWLCVFARGEFGGAGDASEASAPGASSGGPATSSRYPIHSSEEAPAHRYSWPVRTLVWGLSTPVGSAVLGATALVVGGATWWRFFRRIPNTAYITPAVLRFRRTLVGRVTHVGDADGFRMYHTPGLPFLRSYVHRMPTKASELRDQTISVRLAGADAPEAAHFGNRAQPFAKEAREELERLVAGRTVWLDVAHLDQYKRLVATPYVFQPPYIFGRTNVSLALVKKGLATVYRNAGAAYGHASWLQRMLYDVKTGRGRLERAEKQAKRWRRGMWSLGRKMETPAEYKRRTQG